MKNKFFAFAIAGAVSGASYAQQAEQLMGHRVGLGYSQLSTKGDKASSGLKLDYGYDVRDIVGITASYEKHTYFFFGLIDVSSVRFGTDIGYAFHSDSSSNTLKPYFAIGLNLYEEEILGKSSSNTSPYYGVGLRSYMGEHFYLASELTMTDLGSNDAQNVSITCGYKF
ncbi:outer membrane beta-barrel protein [Vibrio sp. WXL103]|uniref:outer membrane beta-barrel protein n=1 Tax=unclassified Vibrio TaxID=2614977 RepID=UPI003EC77AD2